MRRHSTQSMSKGTELRDSTMHYGHDHGVGRWEELLTRDRAEEISQKWPQQDFFTLGLEGKGRSVA